MERFDKIWISSERHLESFEVLKKNRKLISNVLDPNIEEKFYDFPRIVVSGNIFPVIFESSGRLIVSDNGIQFYHDSMENIGNHLGINKGDNIFISYDQMKDISIQKSKTSFIPYFNNSWIKIIYDAAGIEKDILVSKSGKGFVMRKIRKKNIELLSLIESRKDK
jgi:hypothetical protein